MQTQTAFSLDLTDEYLSLTKFAVENSRLSYAKFEELLLKDLNLFVIPKDEHFHALEQTLDKIIRAIPALKRIFTKPITRLKDVHNILPVESVRVINNESMSHVSRHSELWGDISEHELKPKKLMTLDRQENYVIYENVVFSRLIKIILSFTKKGVSLLKDVMYAHRDLRFNLLERTNHLSYFLAIGKLHMGYARAQEKYVHAYERCLDKIAFIDGAIHSKLHCAVYRHCKKNTAKITLKKTNVFRLQKDYRQVYNLIKWFSNEGEEIDENAYFQDVSDAGYVAYCNMLSVFAIGHFNFTFDKKQRFNFMRLNAKCEYKSWGLNVHSVDLGGINGLYFTFEKDRKYSACLIFYSAENLTDEQIENFKNQIPADEYVVCSPLESDSSKYTYLSIFDVDSFRRIQQIVLRGMIYSDVKRDICPFCGHALKSTPDGDICDSCKMIISSRICPDKQEKYFVTGIHDYIGKQNSATPSKNDKFLFDKYCESRLFYRNVTALSPSGKTVCPVCNKIHD